MSLISARRAQQFIGPQGPPGTPGTRGPAGPSGTISGNLSGDVTGTVSTTVVQGLLGVPLPALSVGFFGYNGTSWAFQATMNAAAITGGTPGQVMVTNDSGNTAWSMGVGPSGGVGTSITLTPDSANPGAGSSPGSVVVALGIPSTGGSEASFKVTRNGSFVGGIGGFPGAANTYDAIWLGPGIVPSGLNYTILSDGVATTYFNGVTGMIFQISNSNIAQLSTAYFYPASDNVLGLGQVGARWTAGYIRTGINAGAAGLPATVPSNFTIYPETPNGSASTTATNTPGSFIVALANPGGSGGTLGSTPTMTITQGGSTLLQMYKTQYGFAGITSGASMAGLYFSAPVTPIYFVAPNIYLDGILTIQDPSNGNAVWTWSSTYNAQATMTAASTTLGVMLTQATSATVGVATAQNFAIQAQTGAPVSSGPNNAGGMLDLRGGSPGSGGTGGAGGDVRFWSGAQQYAEFGALEGGCAFFSTIWGSPDATYNLGLALLRWQTLYLQQGILAGTSTTGAGTVFLVKSEQGKAVASGPNNNGGNITFQPGGVGTGGTGGQSGIVSFTAPTSDGSLGNTFAAIGIGGSTGNVWLGSSAGISPGGSNWAFASDNTNLQLNAIGASGNFTFSQAGTQFATIGSSGSSKAFWLNASGTTSSTWALNHDGTNLYVGAQGGAVTISGQSSTTVAGLSISNTGAIGGNPNGSTAANASMQYAATAAISGTGLQTLNAAQAACPIIVTTANVAGAQQTIQIPSTRSLYIIDATGASGFGTFHIVVQYSVTTKTASITAAGMWLVTGDGSAHCYAVQLT